MKEDGMEVKVWMSLYRGYSFWCNVGVKRN
jgi:hypothetical protein